MPQKSDTKSKSASEDVPVQGTRETVESIIVAFVLAFLFRAFVAEAFVIPTGSMAPTLMGAHKDIVCEFCGQQFQNGVSDEFNVETGARTDKVNVAGGCSNCRAINKYDFRGNRNHSSFSGDRILVSKFDYVVSKPKRWDVFVFKYPDKARMNYIKRLVGLPGESLRIMEGDIYVKGKNDAEWHIARKPARKILSMRRVVSDTSHPAKSLVDAGWPDNWQPVGEGRENWKISHSEDGWSANLASNSQKSQVRYFHKVPSVSQWEMIAAGAATQLPEAYDSQLVTDYLAYNNVAVISGRDKLYSAGKLLPSITVENRAFDLIAASQRFSPSEQLNNRGLHWVGDLMLEAEVTIESAKGTLTFDMVEQGIRFELTIDIANGKATLTGTASEGQEVQFGGGNQLTAETSIQGKGNYRIGMSNFDDEICVWINGYQLELGDATYDSWDLRSKSSRRPFWSEDDPLDAAPLGIAGTSINATVKNIKVFRDIYYIADIPIREVSDFSSDAAVRSAIPDAGLRMQLGAEQAIEAIYSTPQWWESTNLFGGRRVLEFQLDDEQYFPMGDNSARSSDARAWTGRNYVEQQYLLGKALLVFWPHTWNSPIPFTPNIQRMGLIR